MKLIVFFHNRYRNSVAPLVGVWIEIKEDYDIGNTEHVAPLVGVWIEIDHLPMLTYSLQVAPLVGVWIEI